MWLETPRLHKIADSAMLDFLEVSIFFSFQFLVVKL